MLNSSFFYIFISILSNQNQIGAGVSGATVAYRLQEQFGDSVSITIFSDELSPHTTSDIAAGLWSQAHLDKTPVERAS